MKKQTSIFANFKTEKLSKDQQKKVCGGNGDETIDPNPGKGKGSN